MALLMSTHNECFYGEKNYLDNPSYWELHMNSQTLRNILNAVPNCIFPQKKKVRN